MNKSHPSTAFAVELAPFVHLLAGAHVGVVVTDAGWAIEHLNATAQTLLDYRESAPSGHRPRLFERWQHDRAFVDRVVRSLERHGAWSGEVAFHRQDGLLSRHAVSLLAIRDASGAIVHGLCLINDESQSIVAQEDRNLAHFDPLTGLPNRLLLNDRLEQAIAGNRRADTLLAVCFMDLDGFKHINDTLGHAAGDKLLRMVGGRMQKRLRESDTVARLGGDEFVMLLSGLASEDECSVTLSRLLADIAEPYVLEDGRSAEITLSIGVALFPNEAGDAEMLLRHADHAMYAAKKAGKNRFQMFDARLEERMQARKQMLRRVGKALSSGQLALHYQPKVDFASGRVVGLEALIRWNHPVLGNLAPAEFIPLIEEDELSTRVGAWVLETALRQAQAWHREGIELQICINTFSRHLLSRDFPHNLQRIIGEVWPAMPEGRLCLEIQESTRNNSLPRLQECILACRRFGVRFALDDFGIGQSSLNSLRLLTIDEIKIYQAFAGEMPISQNALAIVRSILELGHAFELRVVAEGVDSRERVAQLRALGCQVMQGYGIARPMPANQVAGWLADFDPAAFPETP